MFKWDQEKLEGYKNRIVSFIKEYFEESGYKKGIVGLSGGVDSALTYYLACDTLGEKNTVAVIMPTKTTSTRSIENARSLIQLKNGLERFYDITGVINGFKTLLGDMSDVSLGNIAARTRMITLYHVASEVGGLVLGTGNKTELLLGYFTVYGDGACSIEPLGDLYKSEVWNLARYLGVPESIVSQQPSAELWHGQTDEQELGIPYKVADAIIYLLIEKNLSAEEIVERGYEKKYVKKVYSLIKKSKFKRHTPPVPRLRKYNRNELM